MALRFLSGTLLNIRNGPQPSTPSTTGSSDTPPKVKLSSHNHTAPLLHPLHSITAVSISVAVVVVIAFALSLSAFITARNTSSPQTTITCIDDATMANCPPDNPVPDTLYVYQPIIINNSYIIAPTREGGVSLVHIQNPSSYIPIALFLPGNAVVLNSINPLLAQPNTVVIAAAPITPPTQTAEYTILSSVAATQQATFSAACRAQNASMCGTLVSSPGAPSVFFAQDHILIGDNIDQNIIAASQSSRVILDATLTITTVVNNGVATQCIPNSLTDISLFQNLYLSTYPIPGDSCASYSAVVTTPVPIQRCTPLTQLPTLSLSAAAVKVYINTNVVTLSLYQSQSCTAFQENISLFLGCSSAGANAGVTGAAAAYWFIKN